MLRDEWGFGGLVVSDWLGTNERVRACEHGLTLTPTLTPTLALTLTLSRSARVSMG